MDKKGQGISINTIIIAAIGLAVLVVLFAIFTGRLGGFTKGVQETDNCVQKCTSLNLQKGQDVSAASQCSGQSVAGKYSDVTPNSICCCV